MSKENCFYKITNKEIYDKLLEIEGHVIKTNGKVKLNRWIATTALSVVFLLMGLLIGEVI